ncbi:NAD(P)/FAD-dependent oxidoreductase [Epilithonimonas hungarica]|uniref:NADH:ubiquinone reductase (non-electrogenic) n=1 Tax=Epilithonimonas hungarica TaxID=454006 RepID=A0A1G7UJM3_9FLAO|nr:NAD(P)/FAD-dependent oxidoreductase [Epilithonimonas hungarica]SDG47279.1 NADH dehydrogenase [Epilithonimonas hungarica]
MKNQNIIIVGGGFAGVELAERLLNADLESHIILVDKNNYNFFPPLLYQVATGYLDVSNITYPFRKHFRGYANFSFIMGELIEIDTENNTAILSTGNISYDKIVIATGTVTNYFGIDSIRRHALPMKTITDAIYLKNTWLKRIEEASRTTDKDLRDQLTTFVVAGGGPTGVEIAGMLTELKKDILFKDYPELKGLAFEIYLVDGLPKLLAPMSKNSQAYALKSLQNNGVIIRLGHNVQDFKDNTVYLADGSKISSSNLLWTAGVTAQRFNGLKPESYGKGNRLLVDAYNEVLGTKNVYAIGDTALMTSDPKFPEGHPQLAQVAIQQAKLLAKNMIAKMKGKAPIQFEYNDKGSMAIIRRNKAVADLNGPLKHLNGFPAWVIWVLVHLMSLINFRNKLTTFFNWMNAYITKDQPLRMIIDSHTDSKK